MDEAVLCLREFPEAREGRLAGHPFPQLDLELRVKYATARSSPADLSVDGRRPCRKVQGEVREPNRLYNHLNDAQICF